VHLYNSTMCTSRVQSVSAASRITHQCLIILEYLTWRAVVHKAPIRRVLSAGEMPTTFDAFELRNLNVKRGDFSRIIHCLWRLFCRMSSASSSTVTAYNARRHLSTTPTQSSSRAAAARARRSPSSVSGDSVVQQQSYPSRGPGGPAGRGGNGGGNTSPGTTTPHASDNGGHAPGNGDVNNQKKNRMPITPAVLRNIFARSRTLFEERSISRVAFFRCVQI
jgi:hypothetical protein